jgi:hypothetical protein
VTPELKEMAENLIEKILLLQLEEKGEASWRIEGRGKTEAERDNYEQLSFGVGYVSVS